MKIILVLFLLAFQNGFAQEIDSKHPAYNDFSNLKRNIENAEKYAATQKWTFCTSAIKYSKNFINKLEQNYPEVSIIEFKQRLEKVELQIENQNEANTSKSNFNDDLDKVQYALNKLYAPAPYNVGSYDFLDGPELYNLVKDLKIQEIESKINAISEGERTSTMIDIKKKLDDYNNFLNNSKIAEDRSRLFIQKSREATSPSEKLNQLENGILICQAFATISPNNNNVVKALLALNVEKETIKNSMNSIISNHLHANNINQVVWSNSISLPITENDTESEFKGSETIYGVIYLDQKVREAQNSYSALPFEVYVDGELMPVFKQPYLYITSTTQDQSFIHFALIPSMEWIEANYTPYLQEDNRTLLNICKYFYKMRHNAEASHTVKLTFKLRGAGLAPINSEFKLEFNSRELENIKHVIDYLEEKHLENVELPEPAQTNSTLSSEMVAIMNAKGSNQQFSKAIIVSPDWEIEKNEFTGKILRRTLQAALVSSYPDGNCSYQYFIFSQEYTGSGYDKKLKYLGAGDEKMIKCEKTK